MKNTLIAIISISLLARCHQRRVEQEIATSQDSVQLKYAEGFRISSFKGCRMIEVTYPYQGATSAYRYLLVPRQKEIPEHDPDVKIIRTPIQSIVCTSTTHIPLLDYLGETDKLIGFPSLDYISSEKARARINTGHVQELGKDSQLNIELLAVSKPSIVMGYTTNSDYGQFKKIEALGIPVIINAEYLEKHPLGRAEWIKFMGVFFDKEHQADSVFSLIEKNYHATEQLAATVQSKPTVLSGIIYGDGWFLPGGKNYASQLLSDAGCDYLWASDSSHGWLELNFETVYDRARNADLWIGVGTFHSLNEIKTADHRYATFQAFQQQNVYTYNGKLGEKGGSEFLELGYLRPDIVLKDLVKIAHPELLPHDTLYFHKKLKQD